MSYTLPLTSVRGAVRYWIAKQGHLLGDSVLEVGSKIYDGSPWMDNRSFGTGDWLGIDTAPGDGVDEVQDVHRLPSTWAQRFSSVLCSEVLEHVQRPWVALPEMHRVIRPGGSIILTTLTSFPLHGYPDDYYRFTESGLRTLLEDAGFSDISTESMNSVTIMLNDHGEPQDCKRQLPIHVFAVARA